ncbi:MAG TPA: Rid family hydrolase [Sphingomicrobium sp.]|nr:Rid family hydrolase [Sphingomicrobium sp.]
MTDPPLCCTTAKRRGRSAISHISSKEFLTRMGDCQTMNSIYARHFTELLPARTTVGVAALPLDACVEIDMIAKQ